MVEVIGEVHPVIRVDMTDRTEIDSWWPPIRGSVGAVRDGHRHAGDRGGSTKSPGQFHVGPSTIGPAA